MNIYTVIYEGDDGGYCGYDSRVFFGAFSTKGKAIEAVQSLDGQLAYSFLGEIKVYEVPLDEFFSGKWDDIVDMGGIESACSGCEVVWSCDSSAFTFPKQTECSEHPWDISERRATALFIKSAITVESFVKGLKGAKYLARFLRPSNQPGSSNP